MLSRLAITTARPVLASQPARFTQTSSASNQSAAAATTSVAESSERDLVNFPRPVRPIEPGKVRMGFIPDEWFQFFHSKTGVTGPYAFGAGLITFLCSKEIYVMEHEFYTGISIAIMAIYAIKKFGPAVAKFADSEVERVESSYMDYRNDSIKALEDAVKSELIEQDRAKAQSILFEAKRENVALQLEAAYRERLMTAYKEVKRRLDYQVERLNVERRMQQNILADYVVRNVRSSITADQEKAALQQCIANLKFLAKQHGAVSA